ncbi:MAG TPA: hypothetical protein VHS96_11020, partial [Bacteroidia bacterium]|nr:hypothetical protein [Bacteroidia bacterium]
MKKKSILLVLVSSLVVLGFGTVYFTNSFPFMKESNTEPVMFNLKAGDSYKSDWAKVDSLDGAGLPESAQKLVMEIMHKAQREENQTQLFKCVLYTMKHTQAIQEESIVKNIEFLAAKADSAPFPLKPLLHSALAQHYQAYFEQNSWRFYNRTETVGIDEKDVRTWDRKKIINAAAKHYHLSLQTPDSLRRVNLDFFDEVLHKQTKSRNYRPSLYDLLA